MYSKLMQNYWKIHMKIRHGINFFLWRSWEAENEMILINYILWDLTDFDNFLEWLNLEKEKCARYWLEIFDIVWIYFVSIFCFLRDNNLGGVVSYWKWRNWICIFKIPQFIIDYENWFWYFNKSRRTLTDSCDFLSVWVKFWVGIFDSILLSQ